jgi:hypothetical protein
MFLDPTWARRALYAILALVVPGVIAALAYEWVDAFYAIPIVAVTVLFQIAAALFLYYRYFRITATVALEGRDIPLPGPEPLLDTGERAFRLFLYGIVLSITMVPVMCILLCPVVLLGASLDSDGGFLFTLVWSFFTTFTIGLIFWAYQLVGQTRYFITRDFGGSLSPRNIFRLFQGNPGGWLLAAFFPLSISFVSVVIRLILMSVISADGWFDTAINVAISTPLGIYTVLVGFHLAGQAFRLAQPSTVPARPF